MDCTHWGETVGPGRDQLLCVRAPGLPALGAQLTVSGPVVQSSQGLGLGDLDDSSETLSITERQREIQ